MTEKKRQPWSKGPSEQPRERTLAHRLKEDEPQSPHKLEVARTARESFEMLSIVEEANGILRDRNVIDRFRPMLEKDPRYLNVLEITRRIVDELRSGKELQSISNKDILKLLHACGLELTSCSGIAALRIPEREFYTDTKNVSLALTRRYNAKSEDGPKTGYWLDFWVPVDQRYRLAGDPVSSYAADVFIEDQGKMLSIFMDSRMPVIVALRSISPSNEIIASIVVLPK